MKKYGFNNIKELFLSILPAQIFSFVTSSLSGIVNGIIIGNYLTSLDMIALGFTSPIVQIMSVFSTVVSAGARIVCGRFIGRGDKEKVNDAFSNSINLLVIIGAILTAICFFLAKPIASIISNADALEKTTLYLRGISIGILPTLIVPCLMVFLQMRNQNTYALVSTAVLAVSNLSLGLLAMSVLKTNIFGVGLVTSISQYITLVFIIIRYITVKDLPHYKKVSEKLYKEIIIIGIPTALVNLLYALRNSTLNTYAANHYGNEAVNALSILNSSCGPIDAVNIGVGQVALMLASVAIGEKDKESLTAVGKVSMLCGVILGLTKMILIFAFGEYLVSAFGATGSVKELSRALYNAYSLSMPLNMITNVLTNTYQSFGKVKYCNILFALTAYIFPILFVYLLGNIWGINAIFYNYALSEVFILTVIYVYACIKKKHIITNLQDLLVMDNELEVGNHITITIKTIDEVVEVSKRIQDYCLSENVDSKKAMIAGLCAEEIAGNIVEHGFTKSKKKNKAIDIFADVDGEDINIRIKDNAVAFDPHIKIDQSDDPSVNIGIKMVSKLAKDMNYQNTFGLNVLSIRL